MFYKVVQMESGKLLSAFDQLNSLRIEYKVNEWVTPVITNSKLFFFKDFKKAEAFKNIESGFYRKLVIYSCEVGTTEKIKVVSTISFFDEFWENYKYFQKDLNGEELSTYSAPPDSYITDKIRLLEEVG